MDVGRETEKLLERLAKASERSASANERLIELATEERVEEVELAKSRTPGYCPHCTRVNPRVRSEGAAGDLNDVVLVLTCENCNNRFFVLPIHWEIVGNVEALKEAMKEAGIVTS